MIEFRWLVSPRSDADRVLQYRHVLMKVKTKWYEDDVGGVIVPTDEYDTEATSEHWSEWTDVPEVVGTLDG